MCAKNATVVQRGFRGQIEERNNQKQFKAMLIMQYECPGIGSVKLLVGIRHKTFLKVQYCITALEVE